jgi:hypothetical protein
MLEPESHVLRWHGRECHVVHLVHFDYRYESTQASVHRLSVAPLPLSPAVCLCGPIASVVFEVDRPHDPFVVVRGDTLVL